jgi:hypothetical protein
LMQPLTDLFNVAMAGERLRTKKKAATKSLLHHGWSDEHARAFDTLKETLQHCTLVSYPDPDKVQCVFTDASDLHSGGVVTQIDVVDLGKPFKEQAHQPLGFCGHHFNGSELNWATSDKEAYAVVDVFRKLSYLFVSKLGVRLFTDHRNLVMIFNPSKCSVQASQRLTRWSMELTTYPRFIVEHIAGAENVWPDLLSRWGSGLRTEAVDDQIPASFTVLRITLAEDDVNRFRVQPLVNLVWPGLSELREAQQLLSVAARSQLSLDDATDLLMDQDHRVVIPEEAKELRVRLVVISHAGVGGGHCGQALTSKQLRAKFRWPHLEDDVQLLVKSCLHCLPTHGGMHIPRPLGSALHGTKPNEVLHFDYLYIRAAKGDGVQGHQWVLIIRDDFTGLVQLTSTVTPDSHVTSEALLRWRSVFGSSKIYVSDQASYFVGEVLKSLTRRLGVDQHLCSAYIHYPNGTIEVICKLVLQAFRTLISELRWRKEDWVFLLPTVEYYLNHKPQTRLGNRAPITAMSGLPRDDPLELIFTRLNAVVAASSPVTVERMDAILCEAADQLVTIHKDISQMTERERSRHRQHASETRRSPNFGMGDYVLIARNVRRSSAKLYLTWRGPFQVVDTLKGYVFRVKDVLTQDELDVHGERIRFYSHSDLNLTEEIKVQKAFDDETFEIAELLDVKDIAGVPHGLVAWKGFSEAENSWEPLSIIQEDAPVIVKAYQDKQLLLARSRKRRRRSES